MTRMIKETDVQPSGTLETFSDPTRTLETTNDSAVVSDPTLEEEQE